MVTKSDNVEGEKKNFSNQYLIMNVNEREIEMRDNFSSKLN